jgi:hypothetical protein
MCAHDARRHHGKQRENRRLLKAVSTRKSRTSHAIVVNVRAWPAEAAGEDLMRSLFQLHDGVMPESALAALREALLGTGLLGDSQLKGTFRSSRGFGIAFRADARERLLERFPFLAPCLALLDIGDPVRKLRPLSRLKVPTPNAFYVNLLVVGDGAGVGRHVDGTLQDPAGVPGATPEVVTALYLQVPTTGRGGELRLFRGDLEVAVVSPAEGSLLHFRGDLAHAVASLHGADKARMSLICEQYTFAPAVLARLPPLTVQSRAPDPIFAPAPALSTGAHAGSSAFAARLAARQRSGPRARSGSTETGDPGDTPSRSAS